MKTKKGLIEAWNKYQTYYEDYVAQLKAVKRKYTAKNCPLCQAVDDSDVVPPEDKGAYGRVCPVCKSESYWAF